MEVIKKIKCIMLIIIFLVALWLYVKMFFSSALMCFIISVYSVISMMILSFISPVCFDDNFSITYRISSMDGLIAVLDYYLGCSGGIIIKVGYILFCLGAGILYLVYLII